MGCCSEEENPNGCCGWVVSNVSIDEDVEKTGGTVVIAAVDEVPNGVNCGCCRLLLLLLLDDIADIAAEVLSGVFTNDDTFVDDANGVCGCVPNGKLFLLLSLV